MSPSDFGAVQRHLEPVEFHLRQVLIHRNAIVPYVFFPESGQASVLARVQGAEPIEVAMFGREGMSDLAPARKVPLETIIQLDGHGHRIERELYYRFMEQSPALAGLTSRWTHYLLTQTSFNALSHGSFTVVERLARFLLMIHDRADHNELPLVHDFFAWMLAVRRAGVTEAFTALKREGGISTARGKITILNREALVAAAKGSYGPAEAEYERLFGYSISKGGPKDEEG
jgi:CRP-like cAMP-binding protein